MIKYGRWVAVSVIVVAVIFSALFMIRAIVFENEETRNAHINTFYNVIGYMFLVTFLVILIICIFLYRQI